MNRETEQQYRLNLLPEDWERAVAVVAHPDDLEYVTARAVARWTSSPSPTHGVDVTDFLDSGIASLKRQRVYIENLSGDFEPEAFLREMATHTGKRLGCRYAVAFEVIQILI